MRTLSAPKTPINTPLDDGSGFFFFALSSQYAVLCASRRFCVVLRLGNAGSKQNTAGPERLLDILHTWKTGRGGSIESLLCPCLVTRSRARSTRKHLERQREKKKYRTVHPCASAQTQRRINSRCCTQASEARMYSSAPPQDTGASNTAMFFATRECEREGESGISRHWMCGVR